MARTRRAPLRTKAEITRDAIAELQAHMATITTALQALNVQRPPPPPARDNIERDNDGEEDEDDKADRFVAAVNANPFAELLLKTTLKLQQPILSGQHDSKPRYQSSMERHQPKNYLIG